MDISIITSKAYCYSWCNAYTLETEENTAIDNDMICNCSAYSNISLALGVGISTTKASCNGSAFGDISFLLDMNMTMPKAICNCSANNATVATDNLLFIKYYFILDSKQLSFRG